MKEIILQKSNFRWPENIYIFRPLRRLAVEYVKKFNEIKDEYSYCTLIYTDGSKDNDMVGCGLIINTGLPNLLLFLLFLLFLPNK